MIKIPTTHSHCTCVRGSRAGQRLVVVVSGTQKLSLPEDAAVSGLQAAGTNSAGEAAQVEHSGPSTHHQLGGRDNLRTAPTAHCKQTG